MELQNYFLLGSVSNGTEYFILASKLIDGGCYLTKNPNEFDKLDKYDKTKQSQLIKRIIGNSIFLNNDSVISFSNKNITDKDAIWYLEKHFPKSNNGELEKVIELCQGADFADLSIFKNIEYVENWHGIEGVGKGLHGGLGYAGHAFSSFLAKFDSEGQTRYGLSLLEDGKCYIIQEVRSGASGYTVEHHILKNAVLHAIFKDVEFEKLNEGTENE